MFQNLALNNSAVSKMKKVLTSGQKHFLFGNELESCRKCILEGLFPQAKDYAKRALSYCEPNDTNSEIAKTFIILCQYYEAIEDKNLGQNYITILKSIEELLNEQETEFEIVDPTENLYLLINEIKDHREILKKLRNNIQAKAQVANYETMIAATQNLINRLEYNSALTYFNGFVNKSLDFLSRNANNKFGQIILNLVINQIEEIVSSCLPFIEKNSISFKSGREISKQVIISVSILGSIELLEKQMNDLHKVIKEKFNNAFKSNLEIQQESFYQAIKNLHDTTAPLAILLKSSDKFIEEFSSHIEEAISSTDDSVQRLYWNSMRIHFISRANEFVSKRLNDPEHSKSSSELENLKEQFVYNINLIKENAAKFLPSEVYSGATIEDAKIVHHLRNLHTLAYCYSNLSNYATSDNQRDRCITKALDNIACFKKIISAQPTHSAEIANSISELESKTDAIFSLISYFPSSALTRYLINEQVDKLKSAQINSEDKNIISAAQNILNFMLLANGFGITHEWLNFGRLYSEIAHAYLRLKLIKEARHNFELSIQHNPQMVSSYVSLIPVLEEEYRQLSPQDPETVSIRIKIPNFKNKTRLAMVSEALPPYILSLFSAVIQGSDEAYDILKKTYMTNFENYKKFAEYFACFSFEQLESAQINAVYDVALHLYRGTLKIVPKEEIKSYYIKLFEKCAKRGFMLAHFRLGQIFVVVNDEQKLKAAKYHYETAFQGGVEEAKFNLACLHRKIGNFSEAKKLFMELQEPLVKELDQIQSVEKDHPQSEEKRKLKENLLVRISGLDQHISHLESIQKIMLTTLPPSMTVGNRRIVFIDIDNTMVKSTGSPDAFFEKYPSKEKILKVASNPEFIANLPSYYTGSREQWREILMTLKKLGFIIGICTTKLEENRTNCVLFRQIMDDFGPYFDGDYIIFTSGKDKHVPLVEACRRAQVLRKHAFLIDDLEINTGLARAHGLNAVLAEDLLESPESFSVFREDIMKMANKIVTSCDNTPANEISDQEATPPLEPIFSPQQVGTKTNDSAKSNANGSNPNSFFPMSPQKGNTAPDRPLPSDLPLQSEKRQCVSSPSLSRNASVK